MRTGAAIRRMEARAEGRETPSGMAPQRPMSKLARKVMENERERQKAVWRGGRSDNWTGRWRDTSGRLRRSDEWKTKR